VRILHEAHISNPMYLLMTVFSIILHVSSCVFHFILYTPVVIMVYCQDTIIIFCVTI